MQNLKTINKRKMPFVEKGALAILKKNLNKKFFPTDDFSKITECNYIILTLGTPVDEGMNPDYSQINSAVESILPYLKKKQSLILRSTVSPGTTEYVKHLLEEKKNFVIGKDFFLAFCPERIAEGKAIEEIPTIPQIIGGVDRKSTLKVLELFNKIGVECLITDDRSAELAKLFTNMYRYISFAMANEFMVIASSNHRDIYHIIDLVNRNYKRGGLALPGLTAGPCLFKDGFFLVNDLPFVDLISTSWKVNEAIPLFLVGKIKERMKLNGKKAVVLGLAFKANIDDTRESLSYKVKKAFERARANVSLHDPFVSGFDQDVYQVLEGADVIFVATNHAAYSELDLVKIKKVVNKRCLICDIWNVFKTDRIIFNINSLYNNKHTISDKEERIDHEIEL